MKPVAATLIRGDGIGPEIVDATLKVLDAVGANFEWDEQVAGMAALEGVGTPIPEETLASICRTRLALKGPLTTPVGEGYRSVNVALRKAFNLFANVRPARTIVPGGRYENVDVVLIRENTEGLYVGVEHFVPLDGDPRAVAESLAIITRSGCRRIGEFTFDYAARHGRRKVTIVHKANILKAVSGLFLETLEQVAEAYRGRVEVEDRIVDSCAMQLVLDPECFDVIVTTNMFGDILSDEIAGLVGGLGLAPAANVGPDAAVFEAVHGSAPDIAGQEIANPSALMLAAAMMLDHLGEHARRNRLREAIEATIRDDNIRTPDLGGDATTSRFATAVAERLR